MKVSSVVMRIFGEKYLKSLFQSLGKSVFFSAKVRFREFFWQNNDVHRYASNTMLSWWIEIREERENFKCNQNWLFDIIVSLTQSCKVSLLLMNRYERSQFRRTAKQQFANIRSQRLRCTCYRIFLHFIF